MLTFTAISIALAVAASFINIMTMPQGGEVAPCRMFFLTYVGYIFGPACGFLAGITYGLLDLIIKPQIYHPVQVVLDYFLGFGVLGISGFFTNRRYGLYLGYILSVITRLFVSFISGAVFFGEYANGMNVWLYSLLYNSQYILAELALTLVIISLPPVRNALDRVKMFAIK